MIMLIFRGVMLENAFHVCESVGVISMKFVHNFVSIHIHKG